MVFNSCYNTSENETTANITVAEADAAVKAADVGKLIAAD